MHFDDRDRRVGRAVGEPIELFRRAIDRVVDAVGPAGELDQAIEVRRNDRAQDAAACNRRDRRVAVVPGGDVERLKQPEVGVAERLLGELRLKVGRGHAAPRRVVRRQTPRCRSRPHHRCARAIREGERLDEGVVDRGPAWQTRTAAPSTRRRPRAPPARARGPRGRALQRRTTGELLASGLRLNQPRSESLRVGAVPARGFRPRVVQREKFHIFTARAGARLERWRWRVRP